MPTLFENTRDEINTQLLAVSGIGKVYKTEKFSTDWAQWLGIHKNSDNLINVGWFSLTSVGESTDTEIASKDIENFINYTDRQESWTIEQFYGFKDDGVTVSENTFQLLAERIEDKFKFLQTLNGKAFFSAPLQRTYSGLWMLGNVVLCHRAQFTLKLTHRIINPNP